MSQINKSPVSGTNDSKQKIGKVRETKIKFKGKDAVIVHDKLCADGPCDPVTKEPLIDPETGEPYAGKNDDLADVLHQFLEHFKTEITVQGTSYRPPRFGVFSLMAQSTPIFCYDHPAFKKIANTAFTDGIHIFIDADFMRKLVIQEEDCGNQQQGVVFLLLHEMMHKLYSHVTRLRDFPPDIANIAEDMVINGKIIKGFKMDPVPLLLETGVGMKTEEAEKYHSMAEETVASMLLIQRRKKEEEEKKKDKKQQQQQQQGGGGGSGQSGEGDDGEENENNGDKDPSEQNGQGKGKKPGDKKEKGGNKKENGAGGENGEEEEYSPIHTITPEELLEIIEEEGLMDTVGKALDLPEVGDVEGLGKRKDQAQRQTQDAVETALSQARNCDGKYPGQHIAEEASMLISGFNKGKLVWKLGMRKHIMGEGLKLRESDDEASIPWYLTKDTMGVDPWYSGALVPHAPDETVLCLVDTSGSTSGGNMRQMFIAEALNLKKGSSTMGDNAKEVILLSADTVLRGEPILINEYNYQSLANQGVPIFGNGGTDFANCLHQAMSLPMMKKKKVKNVIYFTDCCDAPPQDRKSVV